MRRGQEGRITRCAVSVILLTALACAASKIHVIAFGKWTAVSLNAGIGSEEKPATIKVRALIVDGKVKESVLGVPHEVTDRLFVVRRVFRLNDGLPEDSAPRWVWQRGGWLLVDRVTGRISPINLPDFDPYYSSASWYRDYAAYCGVGEDGKKTYAIVAQLNRRKALLRKPLSELSEAAAVDSACAAPVWQRGPVRVSFDASGAPRQTFTIRGHAVDVVSEEDDE